MFYNIFLINILYINIEMITASSSWLLQTDIAPYRDLPLRDLLLRLASRSFHTVNNKSAKFPPCYVVGIISSEQNSTPDSVCMSLNFFFLNSFKSLVSFSGPRHVSLIYWDMFLLLLVFGRFLALKDINFDKDFFLHQFWWSHDFCP